MVLLLNISVISCWIHCGSLYFWSFDVQGERLKKPKYVYKTAEELLATGPTKRQLPEVTSELAKVKVIDMTGKEQRVLSGIRLMLTNARTYSVNSGYVYLHSYPTFTVIVNIYNWLFYVCVCKTPYLAATLFVSLTRIFICILSDCFQLLNTVINSWLRYAYVSAVQCTCKLTEPH